MKIAVFGTYKEWEEEELKKQLADHALVFIPGTIQMSDISKASDCEALSVFVDSKVGESEFKKMPKLRWIATRSTGYDHVDLAAAKTRNIMVANVPTYGENTVAEYAFALLLALSRKICETVERVRNTGSFAQDNLDGFDLMGKTLGVVGTGHIGLHSIKIGNGFGMQIIAFDVKQNDRAAEELGFRYVSLDELLSRSDIITLHAPYNQHTHHLMGKEQFAKIKIGAFLVNTARGGLVDTAALVIALKEGRLAGAALDVLEGEDDLKNESTLLGDIKPDVEHMRTNIENHYLINHPRVIVSPHNAFNTREAIMRILTTTVENIRAFAAGSPINVVPNS